MADTLFTADHAPIYEGMTVYIRIGAEYPQPGRWRCRTMCVDRVKRTGKVVLNPSKGKTGCERMPNDLYADGNIARGLTDV